MGGGGLYLEQVVLILTGGCLMIDNWHVKHRPWPLPESRWTMAQRWHDLLFAHWPLPVQDLQYHIPPSLPIDTFDGEAWIGVVPFRMSDVRLRRMPALPGISAFPELNVRTYVTRDGKPGVYFFSLDAASSLAVAVARRAYRLPYFKADMSFEDREGVIHYHSHRTHKGAPLADFKGQYRAVGDVYFSKRGSLEYWLTERYALYTVGPQKQIYRADIHHEQWPLQAAEAEIETNTMTLPYRLHLLADREPVLHFARRLDVVVWPLKRLPD